MHYILTVFRLGCDSGQPLQITFDLFCRLPFRQLLRHHVVVIIEQPFRLNAFSVLFYNPFSFLLQLQQRPPPTIQLRPRRLPSRPLRQPETDTQMPPINLRPLSSSLMNSRLNLWQLWHWLASLSQVS